MNRYMSVSWGTLKEFITSRKISVQWIEDSTNYYLKASDGYFDLECMIVKGSSDCEEFEDDYKSSGNQPISVVISSQPAFAAKKIGTNNIFKRIQGIQSSVTTGSNEIVHVISYDWVKITGVEIIGGEFLDTVSLVVLDSDTGRISGIPDYPLNQFGFSVNVAKDFYRHVSEFDADLLSGLQIKITYTSVSNKNICINFLLTEVKAP